MNLPLPVNRRGKPKRSTYERALDMLEARARGVVELRRLLLKKGEPEAEVDEAIARLQRSGLLNDPTYAQQFARSKAAGAGLSRRRLQQELTRRGVARDVSEAAIDAVFADEGVAEDAAIERVARKKVKLLTKLDPPTQRRRLYAFLARRGYERDDIVRVMQRLLQPEERDT